MMEKYKLEERLPPCNVPVTAHAVNGVHYRAVFDGIDFAPMLGSGKVLEPFLPGAVKEWSPIPGDRFSGREIPVSERYRKMVEEERAFRALQAKIAYDAAREAVEIDGVEYEELPIAAHTSAWYDISGVDEYVADRVAYLEHERVGKLERLEGEPNIVRVLDL